MNIGIDARQLSKRMPAGVGKYLREILQYLLMLEDGNNYFLYSNREIYFNLNRNEKFQKKVIKGNIGTLWVRNILPKYLKKDQIDVFWGPEHILPCKIEGIAYIVTIHDLALIINRRWGTLINSLVQNLYLKSSVLDADKIIAISECTKNDLVKLYKVDEKKIKVIYNGGFLQENQKIDENTTKLILEKFHIATNYFIYVGTIEPRKNIELIVDGFEQYCNAYSDAQLVIVGKLGWKYKRIMNKIKQSKVREQIIYTGYVTEKEKSCLLANAVALIYPSYYEGFGIPVIEAMSLKVPVITNEGSSLREVGGDAAFYITNEKDKSRLVELMIKCMGLAFEQRKYIGEKCIEQARKFMWEKCAKNTYEEIIEWGKTSMQKQ